MEESCAYLLINLRDWMGSKRYLEGLALLDLKPRIWN